MSKTLFRSLSAAIALLVAAAFSQPAEAGRRHHHHHGGSAGALIGGLAVGAIIGGALSRDRVIVEERVYVDDAPRPWTGDWYAYCASKYRSFDSDSGTFVDYDGEERFCE